MPDLADIDSVSQVPECVGFFGDPGLPCSSGKIPPEAGNAMAASDFACDVDSESRGPSCRRGSTQTCQISMILTVCRR